MTTGIPLSFSFVHDSSNADVHVTWIDRFDERRTPSGHDTGSDFGLFVTRAQWKDGQIYPVITPTTNNTVIASQQQPTQYAPCRTPIERPPSMPGRQCCVRNASGDWQRTRHLFLNGSH